MAEPHYSQAADSRDDATKPAGAARSPRIEDPLAELARLIGQEDPFKDFFKDELAPQPKAQPQYQPQYQPQPAQPQPAPRPSVNDAFERLSRPSQVFRPEPVQPAAAPPPPPVRAPQAAAPAARPAPAAEPAYPSYDEPAEYDRDHGRDHGRDYGAEAQAYDPYYSEDGHMPPHGEGLDEEPPRSRSRMALTLVGIVVGLAVLGTGGVLGYRALVGGGEPPVIKADTSPSKVAPANTQDNGGQKLIYDRVGSAAGGGEKLVSREEQPVELGRAGQPRVVLPGATDPAASEPRKVKTLVVRPDGTVVPNSAAPAAPAVRSVSAAPASETPVVSAMPPQPAVARPQPMAVQPQPPTPRPVTPAPPQPRVAAAPASGGFVVQVSAARSEAEAQAALRSVQSKYASVLSGQPTSVRKVSLGDKGTFYRAHIGPFGNREQANDLCTSLRSAGGDCIVQQRN